MQQHRHPRVRLFLPSCSIPAFAKSGMCVSYMTGYLTSYRLTTFVKRIADTNPGYQRSDFVRMFSVFAETAFERGSLWFLDATPPVTFSLRDGLRWNFYVPLSYLVLDFGEEVGSLYLSVNWNVNFSLYYWNLFLESLRFGFSIDFCIIVQMCYYKENFVFNTLTVKPNSLHIHKTRFFSFIFNN